MGSRYLPASLRKKAIGQELIAKALESFASGDVKVGARDWRGQETLFFYSHSKKVTAAKNVKSEKVKTIRNAVREAARAISEALTRIDKAKWEALGKWRRYDILRQVRSELIKEAMAGASMEQLVNKAVEMINARLR